ncbi:MAG: TonB-dependent receptor [Bacteroidota bacterium]
MRKFLLAVVIGCCCTLSPAFSQTSPGVTIKGRVTDGSSGEAIGSVSVRLKNSVTGTTTDPAGNFRLNIAGLPATLLITHASYEQTELNISRVDEVSIRLTPSLVTLEGVLLASKGIPTKIIDAAFSAELLGLKQIKQLPTTSVYDALAYIKGIELTTSSLTFKTPSTRGFNGSGSYRVNQLIDGMDNQAPGLNFFVGNFNGPTDLDMESIEILPGASSALYGPGGMNGTILINSKSPFKYQGLSLEIKQGIMHVDKRQRDNVSHYNDYTLRWAKAFHDKFAFKFGLQYLGAKDWLANDSANYSRSGNSGKLISGTRLTDPNYDGVNVYGDETSVDVRQFVGAIAQGLPPGSPQQNAFLQVYSSLQNPTLVSRTGYAEKDLIDPETNNLKLSGAFHYKVSKNIEAIVMGNWSTGNTVYTDDNRYSLKGIKIGQYKFELNHKKWFFRTYTTQEDAGEAYSATVATQRFNEAWKRSYDPANPLGSWYFQYASAYAQAVLNGMSNIVAHNTARAVADQGRPEAGSTTFKQLFDQVRKTPIPNGGLFKEKSQLWMSEGQYRFGDAVKSAEIIAGVNYKKYVLNSTGTLFIDSLKALNTNEIGGYVQVTRKLFDDKLTLTGSGRFDKNDNFKGKFTPRAAALIRIAKDNNLRVSYQTAYRFPSNLEQWIRLNVGNIELLGGLPWVMEYMHADKNPVYQVGVSPATPYVHKDFKPETMRSFEIGYKGLIKNKLLIDGYAYFGKYEDFLGRIILNQPATNKNFSIVVNSSNKVKTHGFGIGLDYKVKKNYSAFLNIYSDVITDVPLGFKAYFNAPNYKFNAGVANAGLGKKERIGFNVMMRWQDNVDWEGELANGPLPAFATADAQLSYKLHAIKSMIRIGGTNIFNRYYKNAYAAPMIGGLYYIGFLYNL